MVEVSIDERIGTVVAGRFHIEERLGDGGMGVVYRARQEPIGRDVALKLLLRSLVDDDKQTTRFLNEARIISALKHPNTVTLIDFGCDDDGTPFIAMEYARGGQLGDLMKDNRLSPVSALRIARQICLSLAEAHASDIVHRDLKPDNVLLDHVEGSEWVVKVVDFGLAKLQMQVDGNLTAPGTRLGTPKYMSPEQAFARPVDATSDLYSLGLMLFQMLTGHHPFVATSTREWCMAHAHEPPPKFATVAPDLAHDVQLEDLVQCLLAKKQEDRPQNAREVARTIEEVLVRLAPPTAPPQGIAPEATAPQASQLKERGEAPDDDLLAEEPTLVRVRRRLRREMVLTGLVLVLVGLVVALSLR